MPQSGLSSDEGFQKIFTLMLRSVELRHERRWIEALACLDEAIAIHPQLPLCQVDRARVLSELQRYEEALESLDFFLDHSPPSPEIVSLRQEILHGALTVFGQALNERPDDLNVLLHRGDIFRLSRQYPKALMDYASILDRHPEHIDALNNQGNVFVALNRYEDAINCYTLATSCCPDRAEIWYNLGNVVQFLGRLEEARRAYQRAIELVPEFAEAKMEIGHCWLSEGNYSAGWSFYEWRWRTGQMKNSYLQTHQPLWLGGKTHSNHSSDWQIADNHCLNGKTLLVWAEQGIGDTLQFVRFVPKLLAEAGNVILRVQTTLRSLIQGLDDRIQVIGDEEPLPFHDFHCPLMSLPFALDIDILPCSPPYLHADRSHVTHWEKLLGRKEKLRVGIVWAGRQAGVPNQTRDIPLSMLAPLASVNVELISLQKDIPPTDAPALEDLSGLCRCGELLNDLSDTADLIKSLDLVISVDTAIVHLAGALGKPCWLMLRYSGEWRWLRERPDSPWYPTMRIFRQSSPGNWEEVISQITGALSALVISSNQLATAVS